MKSPFTILSANEWLDRAAAVPASASLFRNLWHEGEMVCLMDKARSGKTALAMHIAGEIAKTRRVLLVDFATTLRQFAARNKTRFSNNIHRIGVDRDTLDELGPEGLMEKLEEAVKASGIKVCVIDSLTWLCDYFHKTEAARWFMRRIASMRRRLGLSILVLAERTRRIEPFIDNFFTVSDAPDEVKDVVFPDGMPSRTKDRRGAKSRKPATPSGLCSSPGVRPGSRATVFSISGAR